MGLGKDKHKGLGYGVWCLTLSHTVAQSAVADMYFPGVNKYILGTKKSNNFPSAKLLNRSPPALAIYVGIYHGASAAAFFVRLM